MIVGQGATKRLQFFVSRTPSGRRRRVSDALVTSAGAVALALTALAAEPASGAEQAVIDLAATVPGAFAVVWQLVAVVLGTWLLVVLVSAAVCRRWAVLVDVAIGVAVAAALWAVVDTGVGALPGGGRIPVALALAAVAIGCARPHLGRPYRRVGRWLTLLTAVGAVLLGRTTPAGAVVALLVAVTAAGLTHVLVGTEEGRPDPAQVMATLRSVGRPVESFVVSPHQQAGVFVLEGTSGRRLVAARVFGRDAQGTQLAARAWRALWYRGGASVLPTRVQQAEHEAFVTMLAGSHGARVPTVVAVTRTVTGDAVLVLDTSGPPPEHLDADRARSMWRQLDALHAAGLAVRDVDLGRFAVTAGGEVGFGDLSTAGLADADDERLDRVQLLVMTTQEMGQQEALDVAHRSIGDPGLGELVPYLQAAALGPSLRARLRSAEVPVDLDDLRGLVARRAGVESPELARLRRVSIAALVRATLITVAAYSIISLLGGIDLGQLGETLSSAVLGWVLIGLLLGQLPVLSETASTQGASVRRLALGPLVALQSAIGFVKLAVPSTAARVATVVRYFQKQGVPPAEAVSISAIETFAGFLVQVAVLLATLVLGFGSVSLDVETQQAEGTSGLAGGLLILAIAAVVVVVVAFAWPTSRRRILGRVRPWLHQVRTSVVVLRSPARVVALIGGNLASQLLFAAALAACARAFGVDVDLADTLVVYVVASLFGGFMPVPGGIGVMEAALTVGLMAVGVTESAALAAAVTFRIVTFYVPPLWGAAAFRWLERHGYL